MRIMESFMVSQYLQLLGCENASAVSEKNLFLLHEKHLEYIPYTNYRIFFNAETPSLDLDSLFERIVLRRQGGYCFELNGLFADLLRSLGYKVTEYFARWHAGETAEIPMRRHRVALVQCRNKRFLTDVGTGCLIPCTPLEFVPDVIQKKNIRSYRIVKDPVFGNLVQAENENGFYTLYSFEEAPYFPRDFEYVNFYCSQDPASPFRKKLFLHKQGREFRIFLEPAAPDSPALCLCEMRGGEILKKAITSPGELHSIFEKVFGITLPEEIFEETEKIHF